MTPTTPTGGSRPAGPCGEHREHIADLLASCDDYLRRIRRTLQGGHTSRHYVTEKAQALRNAASSLLAGCHDVEGWLRQCGDEIIEDWDGEPSITECELEAGHRGPHQAGSQRSPMGVATDAGRDLAGAAQAFSDHLDWLAPRGCLAPDVVDDMPQLARGLREVTHALSKATRALDALWTAPRDPGSSDEEELP